MIKLRCGNCDGEQFDCQFSKHMLLLVCAGCGEEYWLTLDEFVLHYLKLMGEVAKLQENP